MSHAGVRFVLGQFHPPIKELENSPIRHRPSLPHLREAVGSGSRYRTIPSNVQTVRPFMLSPFALRIPSSREPGSQTPDPARIFTNPLTQANDATLTLRRRILRGGGGGFRVLAALRGRVTSNNRNSNFARNFVLSSEGPDWAEYTSTRSYP